MEVKLIRNALAQKFCGTAWRVFTEKWMASSLAFRIYMLLLRPTAAYKD
jgi:hypothetical protein